MSERPPSFLYASDDPFLFPGANVFVAAVVLRRGGECVASDGGSLRRVQVRSDNWWRALHTGSQMNAGVPLGEVFDVSASMTAGQAYSLLPFLTDGRGEHLRFVTTGLIDPGVCLWGKKVCRYLGRRFERPSLRLKDLPEDLAKRVSRMRRPKVLVAGLSTRVESFLDVEGTYIGAVSTYSITHPSNDLDELARLCDQLNSDASAERLHHELGATALGGGRMTLTKLFLRETPLAWKSINGSW